MHFSRPRKPAAAALGAIAALAARITGEALASPAGEAKAATSNVWEVRNPDANDGGRISSGNLSLEFRAGQPVAIEDFIGRIQIAAGDGPITAMIYGVSEKFQIDAKERNGVVEISGLERLRFDEIYRNFWRRHGDFDRQLAEFIEGYPTIKLVVPRGTDVQIVDSFVIARGGDLGGALEIKGGMVEAEFGDVATAYVNLEGAGDILLGEVAGLAEVAINGSGDFDAVSAGSLKAQINGSGDIAFGPVTTGAAISVSGSGDVDVGKVGGPLSVSISGSGDVDVAGTAGGAQLTINGSGDIGVGSVDGPTTVGIFGSGEIEIRSGRAENLKVEIPGSGDFILTGVSTNLVAFAGGSATIRVDRNDGALVATGDGEVWVSGHNALEKKRR